MKILKTYARIFANDLAESLPVFEHLVGRCADFQVPFEDATLASVGDFLLIAGPGDAVDKYRDTIGPVIVDDLDQTEREFRERGATTHRYTAPTGEGSYIRHPDGVTVEYVQWHPELVERIIARRPAPDDQHARLDRTL